MDDTWSIGIDIGTASIRTCITAGNGQILSLSESPLSRSHHAQHQECITQSSTEIWEIIKTSIKKMLASSNGKVGRIKGVGVAATCSLVVLLKQNGKLMPYPVDFGFSQPDQNVVLWMDHRAKKEAIELNEICKDEPFMSKIGGSFIPEMGVPKLKHLVHKIPPADLPNLLFMELHDYVSIMLMTDGDLDLYQSYDYNCSHAHSEIALDGSTKGWSKRLLDKFGLSNLSENNFNLVGRSEASCGDAYLPLPFAGSRVGVVCETLKNELGLPVDEEIYIGHGVIDCYAGWISTVRDLDTTLSMVAGTSTCFLIASANDKEVVPGVWGPFNNFIKDHYISEAGASATGALLEHLFKTHPAYKQLEIEANRGSIFDKLDSILDKLTQQENVPIANYLTKHMFLYGDILGNRTPYADPEMSGAFIGESSDATLKNLALKYLCILEFLALQTRQITTSLIDGGYSVDRISMSGSQYNNKRLITMIEAATRKKVVSCQGQKPLFTVVKGASMLGFAAAYDEDIHKVMRTFNSKEETKADEESIPLLQKLLDAKYEIMIDMAETQRRYRGLVNEALGVDGF